MSKLLLYAYDSNRHHLVAKINITIYSQIFCISLFVLSMQLTCQAENLTAALDWKIVSSNDVITVYEGDKHDSGIVPIKFHAILDYSPSKVRTVLSDTTRRPEWVPNMVEARVVERVGVYGKVEYLRYAFPWPFLDRSYVLQTDTSYNPKNKTLFTQVKSIFHSSIPQNENYVRAHTYVGTTLTRSEASGKKTYLEAMFLTDMKGNIPKWIFNNIQQSWPKKIVDNLRQQLSRDDIEVMDKWRLLDIDDEK